MRLSTTGSGASASINIRSACTALSFVFGRAEPRHLSTNKGAIVAACLVMNINNSVQETI